MMIYDPLLCNMWLSRASKIRRCAVDPTRVASVRFLDDHLAREPKRATLLSD